jgi:hypothetical protein
MISTLGAARTAIAATMGSTISQMGRSLELMGHLARIRRLERVSSPSLYSPGEAGLPKA